MHCPINAHIYFPLWTAMSFDGKIKICDVVALKASPTMLQIFILRGTFCILYFA